MASACRPGRRKSSKTDCSRAGAGVQPCRKNDPDRRNSSGWKTGTSFKGISSCPLLKERVVDEYQGQEEGRSACSLAGLKPPAALPGTYAEMRTPAVRRTKGKVDILKGKVGVLKGKVDILKGKVDILKGKVGVLKGKVDILKGKVDILKGKVDILKGKVGVLKSEVGALKKCSQHWYGSVQHLHGQALIPAVQDILPGP